MNGGADTAHGPRWWVPLRPRQSCPHPRARLLVLPHSGSGPNAYRPLIQELPAEVEVLGLNLPGRERRVAEPPAAALEHVLESLAEIRARPGAPTVVFGHSLGALLALRVAAELGDACSAVIVSGQLPGDRDRWFEALDTEADLLRLLDLGGGALAQALAEPSWRSAVLATLRADLRLGVQAARDFGAVRVGTPITVLGGKADRVVDPYTLPEWAAHTSARCRVHMLAGGHFAVLDEENRSQVTDIVRDAVLAAATSRFRLLCLPFAGAGAGIFTPWRRQAPMGLKVVGIQLPGRENRIREPAVTTVAEAVTAVLPEVIDQIAAGDPAALFGHSMGAVLAFEVARRLEEEQPGRIERLFVSGSPAPWQGRNESATGLPDAEFLARVQRFAGYQHQALAEPALRALVLPALRADVELHEHYRPERADPLKLAITAIRGAQDELVSAGELAEWSGATSADFDLQELPGQHMYLVERPGDLLSMIARRLGLTSP